MRTDDIKHFLKFFLSNILRAKKLIQCNMIYDINKSFQYITKDRYPIHVDLMVEYDPDTFAIQLDFDLTGLPGDFIYETLCFDKKDNLFLLSSSKLKIDLEYNYNEWLQEDAFFQSTLINNFGSTNLQYWKDCMHLLERIEKEIKNV